MEENYKAITTALGIYDLGNKYLSELSGGQDDKELQQREHLFTNHKSYLQMSQQAHSTGKSANNTTLKMNKSFDTTIVMVTHDPVVASCRTCHSAKRWPNSYTTLSGRTF